MYVTFISISDPIDVGVCPRGARPKTDGLENLSAVVGYKPEIYLASILWLKGMVVEASFLQASPYFSNLSDEELNSIQKRAFEKVFQRGDLISLEGKPAPALYFVISGAVKIFKTSADGKEQILSIVRPGESFNDVPVFDDGPSPTSAQAMGPVASYGIEKRDLDNILREHCQVALNVISVLAGRVRQLTSLVEDLSFRPVVRRVAKILLEYAGDGAGSGQRLTQQEMAAMAGTAREVVARSLKALEGEGLIKMERHRIIITDRKALEDMAEVSS
jgi:CRP/FNR family cyclic AMP-dependent transcriptional regulator